MRARNIKPALFKNELLGRADPLITLLFEGLWCVADRCGRLEDRPDRLRADIFPYREGTDVGAMLGWLQKHGFIDRYRSGGVAVISVKTFSDHQHPHHKEPPSKLPDKTRKSLGQAQGRSRAKPSSTPDKPKSDPSDSGFLIPDPPLLIPDSGSPLPAAAPQPEPERRPGAVLKNGFGGEDRKPEIRAEGAARPIGDILAGMKQRFQRA